MVRAIARDFGLVPGLRAVRAVRGTDRDVNKSAGVAQDRGEDIRGPQVCARHEPRDLLFSRAVARLSRCVHQRSDRVVTARGFAHRAASHVGRARVQGPGLAGSTRHGFARPSAAQAQADRVDILLGLHHGTVVRFQAPHPRVVNLGISKFLQPCAGPQETKMHARVHEGVMRAWIFMRFRARGCSSSPSPSSGVVPRACRREGMGRSCMASSVPERTLRQSARGLRRCARHTLPRWTGSGH